MTHLRVALVLAALASTPACAHRTAPVVSPEAPLGRVIVYRNGVAYFERHAVVDGELSLKVPRARVDDFLKSLTVVDVDDGKPLAISYATPRETGGAFIDMTIELPPGRREVRITYVTESPAWKPSYRVELEDDGDARLQSWAVVDNVSGEAWDHVQVGVGSTSALSFRYDLHSVRVVERETIDQGSRVALAPPTGGSPYAIDGDRQRVLANVSVEELEVAATGRDFTQVIESSATAGADFGSLGNGAMDMGASGGIAMSSGASKADRRHARGRGKNSKAADESAEPPRPSSAPAPQPTALDRLAAELQGTQTRVRIEGNAIAGEAAQSQQGLRRANTLREALVARGISTERIDVIDGGEVVADAAAAVQVVAIDDAPAPTQATSDDSDDGTPRGTAHFVADGPITLDAGHSAMVTLLDEPTKASRVYLYDPDSERGSRQFAFNAVRIDNPSDHTLDTGPVTVYADQQFLGEGLAEPIPPKSTAVIPYALDRTLRVRPRVETRERIQRLLKVERGIATTETQRIRATVLEIDNRGTAAATIYVRHHVASGWDLLDPPEDIESLGDDVLVPVTIAAGRRREVVLEEAMPITTSIDLRSETGFRAVEVYLESADVAPALATRLGKVLDAHRRLHDIDDELATSAEQIAVLRTRVDELNFQLVTLRKVDKAQTLSAHLAKRMKTLGDELDDATIAVTELQTQRLTARIELSNLVADLSLEERQGGAGGSANASPSP